MVVWKWMSDENGENPKEHPVVIISKQEHIDNEEYAYVWGVVASHTAALIPHPDNVPLPHGRRKCFSKKTVAVCRWRVKVVKADVKPEEIGHTIQTKHLEPVLAKVREMLDREKASKSPKSE
jgi:hypothetical protein